MAAGGRKAPAIRTWARTVAGQHPDIEPLALVGVVAASVASAIDDAVPASLFDPGASDPGAADAADAALGEPVAVGPVSVGPDPAELGVSELPEPPGGWANPWLPGLVHEQAVSAEDRGARGAWYTPESVVRGLVELATDDDEVPPFAADPTCGGGAFLLAMLDRYVTLGVEPDVALTRVAGMDIDADAVRVSRWSLQLWALLNDVVGAAELADVAGDVTVGDALAGYPDHWPSRRLVVGNPPFATPLRTGAVPPELAEFRAGREHLLGPYADLAAVHLLAAVEGSGAGSVVALVQPQSVLAGRDTGPLRDHCDAVAPLHAMWAAREPVFDAGVRACAVVLRTGVDQPNQVRLAAGPQVTRGPGPSDARPARPWSFHAARALGAPDLPAAMMVDAVAAPVGRKGPESGRSGAGRAGDSGPGVGRSGDDRSLTLGALATATAGFRDEYYGLVEACAEWAGPVGEEPNRLLTVGGVEPLASRWGVTSCRFGGRQWLRPWIDVDRLSPKVKTWTTKRLAPKVVVATQSKLLEPVIDRDGSLVPATPLLAVHAAEEDLGLVAAVLLAPPVVAWAWQRWFGAAMAVDALKLAARQIGELPLPMDRTAWADAGRLLTETVTDTVEEGWELSLEAATIMNAAYEADDSVLRWWRSRAKVGTGRGGPPQGDGSQKLTK